MCVCVCVCVDVFLCADMFDEDPSINVIDNFDLLYPSSS